MLAPHWAAKKDDAPANVVQHEGLHQLNTVSQQGMCLISASH